MGLQILCVIEEAASVKSGEGTWRDTPEESSEFTVRCFGAQKDAPDKKYIFSRQGKRAIVRSNQNYYT